MLPQRLEDMPEAPQQANKLPVSVLAHRATFVEAFRTCGVSTMPSSSDHTHDLAQTYGNSPTTEVAENASMTDHMPQGSRITRPTFLEGRRLFPATSSHDGMDHAEEETAVNPSSSATEPEVLR